MLTRRRSRRSQRGGVKIRPNTTEIRQSQRIIKKPKPSNYYYVNSTQRRKTQRHGKNIGTRVIKHRGNKGKTLVPGLSYVVRRLSGISNYPIKNTRMRRFLDPLTPSAQCSTLINKATGDMVCWICGFPLDLTKVNIELKPICDHVLPVIGATIYFEILQSKKKIPLYHNELQYEYRYAHNVCNRYKSSTYLIDIDASGMFIPSETACKNLLNKILYSSKNPFTFDVNSRYNNMVTETLNPLCEILNRKKAIGLLTLAGTAGILQKMEEKKAGNSQPNIGEQNADNSQTNMDNNTNMMSEHSNTNTLDGILEDNMNKNAVKLLLNIQSSQE